MGWFRNHRQSATGAALFALFLQFALSFGHVHVPGGHASGHDTINPSVQATAGLATQRHQHPQNNPADDLCSICLVSGLLASAQPVAPPILPVPSEFTASAPVVAVPAFTVAAARTAFRSRGPPQA